MRVPLKPHLESPALGVRSIEVELDRSGDRVLRLSFLLECSAADLQIPDETRPQRADRLWDTTCFELFVKQPGEQAYLEFNFSPSTRWAVYSFTGYRDGMAEAPDRLAPRIRRSGADTGLTLDAEIRNLPDPPWRLGLSAVIAAADGRRSYWAFAHPPGNPDFHHPDCFALELPPPAERL